MPPRPKKSAKSGRRACRRPVSVRVAMTTKSTGQILTNKIEAAVAALKSCVTPIFDVNDKGQPKLLGSAVLIQIGDEVFLSTAKHVTDGNKNSTLYIDGPSKLVVLEGEFHVSSEHDTAVLKLSHEQVKLL